ncbi:MAG: cytochrome c [Alphaproteobacteria bacterium]|nr:cytochrome c [Alphaproteobacteria bacterium]
MQSVTSPRLREEVGSRAPRGFRVRGKRDPAAAPSARTRPSPRPSPRKRGEGVLSRYPAVERCAIRTLLLAGALLLFGNVGALARDPDKQSFQVIEHGRYMAIAGDCTACHTAKGGQPFAGGGALETPFGTLLAPNITPDLPTGIGSWTDDQFVNAVQNGVGRRSDHLYPAMPYPYYTRMTREDIIAIRAYLDTVEPVQNKVIANQLPFPFNQREAMVGWNLLYFKPGVFKSDPGKSAEWNRGAYLVEGAEHCGLCHTPKNAMGGDENDRAMQGSVLQNWYAPNLTGDRRVGIGDWTTQDIVLYLKTGRNRYDIASGPMAEAVTNSTSHLTDADLRAMAIYLKDQSAGGGGMPQPVSMQDPTMQRGQAIYYDRCAACHTVGGEGIVGLFPRLSGAPLVQQSQATSLIRVVLEGSRAVATNGAPTGPAMPSFAWQLSDPDVAAVVTYIRNSWGNAAPPVAASDVANMRKALLEQP